MSGELTSKIRILAEEPEICLKIEGSLNSISVVIKFKHRIHPNLNLFAENQFIQNLGIKSIYTNVSIIESNEEDCIEKELKKHKLKYLKPRSIHKEISRILNEGLIIARYFGRSEFRRC